MPTPNLSSLINPAPSVAAPAATPAAAPTVQPAPHTDAPASGAPDDGASDSDADDSTDDSDDSAVDTGSAAENVKVQREFSNIGHALVDLADNLGLHRVATIPYTESDMADHVSAVGAAAQEVGGLSRNLVLTFHTKGGKGWGSPEGATVLFNADKLRETLIPEDNEEAKTAISDARGLVNEFAKLLGNDDPDVKTAKSQLALISKHNGQGMNLLDFSLALTQFPHKLVQAITRAVHKRRHGFHPVTLSAPVNQAQQQQ